MHCDRNGQQEKLLVIHRKRKECEGARGKWASLHSSPLVTLHSPAPIVKMRAPRESTVSSPAIHKYIKPPSGRRESQPYQTKNKKKILITKTPLTLPRGQLWSANELAADQSSVLFRNGTGRVWFCHPRVGTKWRSDSHTGETEHNRLGDRTQTRGESVYTGRYLHTVSQASCLCQAREHFFLVTH